MLNLTMSIIFYHMMQFIQLQEVILNNFFKKVTGYNSKIKYKNIKFNFLIGTVEFDNVIFKDITYKGGN